MYRTCFNQLKRTTLKFKQLHLFLSQSILPTEEGCALSQMQCETADSCKQCSSIQTLITEVYR